MDNIISGFNGDEKSHAKLLESIVQLLSHDAEADVVVQNDSFLQTVFDNAPIGISVCDPAGKYIMVNSAMSEMLGYSEEELLGMTFQDVTHPEDLTNDLDQLEALLKGELNTITQEKRYLHSDGTPIWTIITVSIIRDAKNEPLFMVGQTTDITARKAAEQTLAAAEQKLEHHSLHDILTDLPNRTLFMDRLKLAQGRSLRKNNFLAVLYLNIDRFKNVNDSLGHEMGDTLLKAVSERLENSMRTTDTLSRFASDEFTIIVEELNTPSEAILVAQRVLDTFSDPFQIEEREIVLTASLGLAYLENPQENTHNFVNRAAAAMYKAKKHGGNRFEVFDVTKESPVQELLERELELRKAIDHNELILHYQPLIELPSNKVVGFEALVRWIHPERGLIAPLDFIPLAEETGLVIKLGEWVLREACIQLTKWKVMYPTKNLSMAINTSAKQLSEEFPALVKKVMGETGVLAKDICLEITETAFMEEEQVARQVLLELKSLGVQISIDDFGIGYSSFNYLKKFPFADSLKIDKSFIDEIHTSPADIAIVGAIITLANNLGLATIAEGVESAEQLALLVQEGSTLAQGYFFSAPKAAIEIQKLLLPAA